MFSKGFRKSLADQSIAARMRDLPLQSFGSQHGKVIAEQGQRVFGLRPAGYIEWIAQAAD